MAYLLGVAARTIDVLCASPAKKSRSSPRLSSRGEAAARSCEALRKIAPARLRPRRRWRCNSPVRGHTQPRRGAVSGSARPVRRPGSAALSASRRGGRRLGARERRAGRTRARPSGPMPWGGRQQPARHYVPVLVRCAREGGSHRGGTGSDDRGVGDGGMSEHSFVEARSHGFALATVADHQSTSGKLLFGRNRA